jgi:ankyrin repeat protein
MRLLLGVTDTDVNATDSATKTALHHVCIDIDWLSALLTRRDLDVNKPDRNGNTPLHIAYRTQTCCRALLRARADINKMNTYGFSPFLLSFSAPWCALDSFVELAGQRIDLSLHARVIGTLNLPVIGITHSNCAWFLLSLAEHCKTVVSLICP